MSSEREKKRRAHANVSNVYIVEDDDNAPDDYDYVETTGEFAGARCRIEKEEGPPGSKSPGTKSARYSSPYENEEAAKAWKIRERHFR
jgi:hypothetical protein